MGMIPDSVGLCWLEVVAQDISTSKGCDKKYFHECLSLFTKSAIASAANSRFCSSVRPGFFQGFERMISRGDALYLNRIGEVGSGKLIEASQ